MTKLILPFLLTALLVSCTAVKTSAVPVASIPTATALAPSEPWWRNAVFYEIFVRSFYDTNGDGIGDFNGVTAKLDYLSSLGITAIWLMPINPSPSYHGYDVTNYYAVNPQYGSIDDLRRLLNAAHQRGMHVIIDLVLNHTSSQHPFFVDAMRGPRSPFYTWYIWSDTNNGQYWHALQGDPARYYFGLFCDCMPDLNYRNPDVTAQMEKVIAFWLKDVGVDGFRMDAINRLIEEGTRTEDTPATHDWLRSFYQFYKGLKPEAYTVGEVFAADASRVKTYEGDQLDQAFNFELAQDFIGSASTGTNSAADSGLTFAGQTLPDGNYATFLTNHDQNRVMSDLSGDLNKAKLAAFLLLTAPGTPFIYYGEEIGMQGTKPDEDIRRPMQWDATTTAGFTSGTPWRPLASDSAQVNVASESSDPSSLLSTYGKLIALRRAHTALRTGLLRLLNTGNTSIYASVRWNEAETLLLVANLAGAPVSDYGLTLTTPQPGLQKGEFPGTTLFGSGSISALQVGGGGQFADYKPLATIPAYGMYVIQLSPP